MASKNLFAWASIDENGHARGGAAGDQTGKEVKVGYYYDFGQNVCVRFTNRFTRKAAAIIAAALAECDNIGYDQDQRGTLYALAKANDWKIEKLLKALETKKVECDCSSFVATVINLAFEYPKVSCFTTATMLDNTVRKYPDDFKELSILEAEKKFYKGDMPLRPGHHVIINV